MTEIQFKHEPVLLHEVLAWLDPAAGGVFADGTLGGGGHSERILQRIGDSGLLYGIDRDEDALRAAATPRGVWKQLPLTALPLQNAGNDIARHLRGCDAMVLMAVTLGSGADTLMRRLELTDIALAAVVDAMASAVMEELCNALEAEIRTSVQAQGHYLTGRFSPGYGDCPLTLQQPFAIALDTVRGLGMAVTPENLLTPRKSVTAILGVADHPVTGARAGCGHCLLREKCEYRKRGTTCEN